MGRPGNTSVGASEILARTSLTAADIPHPVEGLTVEQAADHAGISLTTVDSAIGSAADFRATVLEYAIRSLDTKPGPAVWAALQEVVANGKSELDLAPLLQARAEELAQQPAFIFFISGFQRLDEAGTKAAVNEVLCPIFLDFWPFVQTAHSAFGVPCPLAPTPELEFLGLQLLLAEGLRLATGPDLDATNERRIWAMVSAVFAQSVAGAHGTAGEVALFPSSAGYRRTRPTGVAAQAVEAGADLLLSGLIEPSTTLTVSQAAKRCQLSVSSFYRHFSSMSEFERQLFEGLGTSMPIGFGPSFVRSLADSFEEQPRSSPASVTDFSERAAERRLHHVQAGRPGLELLAWLTSPALEPLVRQAIATRAVERGRELDRLLGSLGLRSAFGLAVVPLATAFGHSAAITESLTRNCPDPAAVTAWFQPVEEQRLRSILTPTRD